MILLKDNLYMCIMFIMMYYYYIVYDILLYIDNRLPFMLI